MNINVNEGQPNETVTKKEIDEAENNESETEKTSNSNQSSLSKKLTEIMMLINNVRQRLEDLSIERRTEVSQMQWATLEQFKSSSKVPLKPVKFWQNSLFARIYFTDKNFDDIFQNVMKYNSIFYQHLKQFNDKVQCRNTGAAGDHLENPMTQLTNNAKTTVAKQSLQESAVDLGCNSAYKLPKATHSISASNEEEDANNLSDLKNIQHSFKDLMRAKIEFDMQFLNFNAILSKNCFSDDFLYLFKFCANSNIILGQTSISINKRKALSFNNKKLRRKRITGVFEGKSQTRQLRKSMRTSPGDDSSEVQIIRSLRRRKSA